MCKISLDSTSFVGIYACVRAPFTRILYLHYVSGNKDWYKYILYWYCIPLYRIVVANSVIFMWASDVFFIENYYYRIFIHFRTHIHNSHIPTDHIPCAYTQAYIARNLPYVIPVYSLSQITEFTELSHRYFILKILIIIRFLI